MARDRAQFSQMMAELGPLFDLAAVLELDQDQGWKLAVDEDTVVSVERDSDTGKVVLSVEVAVVPAETTRELMEMLLVYNGQWARTGGVRMSLAAPGGTVVQSVDLSDAALDLSALATVLKNFLDIRAGWRTIIDPAGQSTRLAPPLGEENESGETPPAAPPGSIRV
jgi:hypothetical protein